MDSSASEGNTVDLDVVDEGRVAVLTVNRPEARNALSKRVVTDLGGLLQQLDQDESVRVVVLTGSAPGFCAGSDLKEIAAMSISEMAAHEAVTGQMVRSLQHLAMPVVAAVEGFAIGGGLLLATGCDLVVTSEQARWHLPEVGLGWVPPWGLQGLVARAGPVAARRLAWGDRPVTGGELHRLGVVDELADAEQVLDHATALAIRLAALPREAVSSTKRALSDAVVGPAETLDARTTRLFARDCTSGAAQASLHKFAKTSSEGQS